MNGLRSAYDQTLREASSRIAEPTSPDDNELAWQARWFSGACGREFKTATGTRVVVADFGQWNREAGPDFVNAIVRIGGCERRGAIEVDLEAHGWEQHSHATNPAYEDVVLHVVVRRPAKHHFSRTSSHREVPQICLADGIPTSPEWDGAAPARPGLCAAPLRDLDTGQLTKLLEVAATRRLERKGAELTKMISSRGTDDALYEAVAVALGYKANKLPFRVLSQRVPLAAAASRHGEALLFGVAGFLEGAEPPAGTARKQLSMLWSSWWKLRATRIHLLIPRGTWRLGGIRPANHPLRRIGALAALARKWNKVRDAIESGEPVRLERVLGELDHPFWSFHTAWTSPRRKQPLALIGTDRRRAIYANVALPLAMARGRKPAWMDLPAGTRNTPLRVVSARLFGGDIPQSLPGKMFVHQGLLQIHADFCLRDQGECARCRFPALVSRLPS